MNIIEKALQDIRYAIPREVLHYAFNDTDLRRLGIPVSIDNMIKERVIFERVIVDCNLYAARQVEIPLKGITPDVYPNGSLVFRIPKSRTDGCSIVSVLSITYGSHGYGHGMSAAHYNVNSNQLLNATQAMVDSAGSYGGLASARVRLIDENVVLIKENQHLPDEIHIRVNIANDAMMSNIHPASYKKFGKLVELAVKAYIYVNKSIILDEGQLRGGVAIGKMSDFIDNYSDANEMYEEFLQMEWRRTAVANDDETMRGILASQISLHR